MNENLNLVKILKNCPKGTKLYSLIHGEVALDEIDNPNVEYPILVITERGYNHKFTIDGRFYFKYKNSECVLFPSEHQRDWSKFRVPVKKFDYSTLNPFDRMLVRDNDRDIWRCNSFTCFDDGLMVCNERWEQGIPYNHDTKQLAGTTDMPDEKYIWWNK